MLLTHRIRWIGGEVKRSNDGVEHARGNQPGNPVASHNLRKKIQAVPEKPAHILNVRGLGYLFERRRFNRETLNQTL